ncbi:MAG: sigma-54-dependent Fis family transcriptional regulator [Haliscomenobacter sp.]|nr:sigma-54-dependent Fis family transcriptional regulator [Haliscomenobacter sp.]
MNPSKILIVDDDASILNGLYLLLKRYFHQVDIEKDPRQIPFLLGSRHFDLVVLDMNFQRDLSQGEDGFYWLQRILETDPNMAVVFLTAYGDIDLAVRAIKSGAADFVLKPWENDRFVATLRAALDHRKDRHSSPAAGDKAGKSSLLALPATANARMQQLESQVDRVAATDANILILGESGTGKTLLAEQIHRKSLRNQGPYVEVDLGAVPESLLESELFGHVKGAFTDARADRKGRFEEAHGGTLFLDEISNLSLMAQAKLLSVLQQRRVTPVGSNQPRPADVRLICASNQPLGQWTAEKRFRQDLLYRINTIELALPALRERQEDIVPLALFFLDRFAKKYARPASKLSPELERRLTRYPWPGNIRELQHTLERAVILSSDGMLQPADFPFPESDGPETQHSSHLWELERSQIIKTLRAHYGNISETAKALGLSRAALYRRMEKYGIEN